MSRVKKIIPCIFFDDSFIQKKQLFNAVAYAEFLIETRTKRRTVGLYQYLQFIEVVSGTYH